MNDALSPDDSVLLAGVLDTIIPPDEKTGLPGAGEVGLGDAIAGIADLREVIREGLRGLAEIAPDFPGLPLAERARTLEALTATQPAFLGGLVFQTYVHYYRDARVLPRLGMEARPPHPLGYPLETGDLGLLEPVRGRSDLLRECSGSED